MHEHCPAATAPVPKTPIVLCARSAGTLTAAAFLELPDRAGEFPFACLVYCGISPDGSEGHHTMKGLLRVLPEE